MAISGANVPEGKCPASVRIMTLIAHARKNVWSSAEVKSRTRQSRGVDVVGNMTAAGRVHACSTDIPINLY